MLVLAKKLLQEVNLPITIVEMFIFLVYSKKLLIFNQEKNHLLYVGHVKEQVLAIFVTVPEYIYFILNGLEIVAEHVVAQVDVLLAMDEAQYKIKTVF